MCICCLFKSVASKEKTQLKSTHHSKIYILNPTSLMGHYYKESCIIIVIVDHQYFLLEDA